MRDGVLVSEVRVRGPLEAYAVGFSEFLAGQGYAAGSVRLQMYLVAQFSWWLEADGLGAAGFSELAAERFIAARRARVERLFRSRQALEPLMGYLRGLGVIAAPAVGPRTSVEEVAERYRRYLLVERALSAESARIYLQTV